MYMPAGREFLLPSLHPGARKVSSMVRRVEVTVPSLNEKDHNLINDLKEYLLDSPECCNTCLLDCAFWLSLAPDHSFGFVSDISVIEEKSP